MIARGEAVAVAYDLGPMSGALAVPVRGLRERIWLTGPDGDPPTEAAVPLCARSATRTLLMEVLAEHFEVWTDERISAGYGLGGSVAAAIAARRAAAMWLGEAVSESELEHFARHAEQRSAGFPNAHAVAACVRERPVLCTDPFKPAVHELPLALAAVAVTVPAHAIAREKWRKAWPQKVHAKRLATNNALVAEWTLRLTGVWPSTPVEREDGIIERATASLVPGYHPARRAAIEAGATLVAMSGTGPAVAALCLDLATAMDAARAMEAAFRAHALDAFSITSGVYDQDT